MTQGIFITFEGGEGSGKSTQINLLANSLTQKGIEVLTTREPGGTPSAENIRELLVTGDVDKFGVEAEALLNYAARSEHLRHIIRPALQKGAWVISDRFNDSTFAYQGEQNIDPLLQSLDSHIVASQQPNLTFILDICPQTGLMRAGHRMTTQADNEKAEDRFENKGLEYHKKIRERFLARAAGNQHRYVILDASQTIEEIASEIWNHIAERYFNKTT